MKKQLVTGKRVWTFTSTSKGLRQILHPAVHADDGRVTEVPIEANFGGDDGKRGLWRTTERSEAEALRNKMRSKTFSDQCIVEVTVDKQNGDPIGEAKSAPQLSA